MRHQPLHRRLAISVALLRVDQPLVHAGSPGGFPPVIRGEATLHGPRRGSPSVHDAFRGGVFRPAEQGLPRTRVDAGGWSPLHV